MVGGRGGGRGGEREDEGKNGKQDDVKEGEKRQKRSIEKTEDHVEKSKDNVETGSAKEDRTVLKQVAEGKSDFKQKGRSADAMRKEDKSSQKKASTVGDQRLRVEDTKKYKPTIQRSLKIGNFELQGKNIKAEELKPSKSHNSSVRVYKFENFLTERECNGLIQAHKRHVLEFSDVDPIFCCDDISTIEKNVKDAGGKIAISAADLIPETTCLDTKHSEELKSILRWSYSTAFYPGESPFTRVFEERVKQATGLKPSNGGKFQITSYEKGVGYKTHTDCIVGNSDLRDRMGTILVYLDDVPLGGETSFPELGIKVTPKKGMALVWNNMNPDGICEPLSVHTAAKVQEGHKYIIQRWYYHQSFANLGQRAPEPPVPERLSKTARVTCDEYEHGSCRWYDEWNYDHIPDYLQRMNSLS
ncbi:hypothetical protein BSL78_18169 [Apostichopus japonicus]|uniref:Prolyl 4-hydroxylase alpha subunit domain-containing protein n=1 Tax=Stichopus japonicus TaxID=307972 RepID=A0A2G8KAI8_STIJA|nr:hypothetical protein BSL78_18169 [Apostichopus japonicus]